MDQDIRELERRASQGDGEAQSKLLLEKLRSGELDRDRLRLAAYLGDTAALEALEDDAPSVDAGWPLGVQPWGVHVSARVAVAAGRFALTLPARRDIRRPFFNRLFGGDPVPRAKDLLQAVDMWLREQGPFQLNKVEKTLAAMPGRLYDKRCASIRAAGEAVVTADSFENMNKPEDGDRECARLACLAATEAKLAVEGHPGVPKSLYSSPLSLEHWERHAEAYNEVDWSRHQGSEEAGRRVQTAIRVEVVAWALKGKK